MRKKTLAQLGVLAVIALVAFILVSSRPRGNNEACKGSGNSNCMKRESPKNIWESLSRQLITITL